MNQNRLFLLDAYALIFRSYYAFIKNPRINSKNFNTSVIFSFINSLLKLIKEEKPTHIGVCFDVSGQTFRHKQFPNYKANRSKTPESICISIPYIQNILCAMNISIIEIKGYEADDLIGTLAKCAENNNFQTFMVTSDKDYAQLVSENIFIYKFYSSKNDLKIMGVEAIKQKFDLNYPIQIIDFFGMVGDCIDNIPGIPGIGEKTAKKLLKEYDSLENILDNVGKLKGKIRTNIENNKEIGLLSKKLATIDIQVPLKFESQKFILKDPDFDKIEFIFKELEFKVLYETFCSIYFNKNV